MLKTDETEKSSAGAIGIVFSILVQFAAIIWFASALNSRVDKVEAAQASLQQRYEKEVIPRADLTERLDRIEQSLDRIVDRLMAKEPK